MKWSRRKQKAEHFFSNSVKGRVELGSTRYRGSPDNEGCGFILFDKKEIWRMCSQSFYPVENDYIKKIAEQHAIPPQEAQPLALEALAREGVFSQQTYYDSLSEYSHCSIDALLASPNTLIKCLAMLDARLGKRRLLKFDLSQEHQKVVEFYRIRCECEGLKIKAF